MADSQPPPKTNSSPRTFEIRANPGEMIKPAELIDITGTHDLTYTARQMFNRLIAHAHGPDMAKTGYRWTIPLSELRGNHKGNERIQEALLALMRVVVTSHHPDGRTTTNVRLLGDNIVDWEKGTLTFELSGKLVELMRDSTIFGKLELRTMTAFTSKYALALYEMVARRARLNFVFSEEFELEKFRKLLGVPKGKLKPFGNFNKYAIQQALTEINGLSSFGVKVEPIKKGRRVTGVKVAWWWKEPHELAEVDAELKRHSAGRKARISGEVDEIQPAEPERIPEDSVKARYAALRAKQKDHMTK